MIDNKHTTYGYDEIRKKEAASVRSAVLLDCPWCGPEWKRHLMIVDGDNPDRHRRHVFCPNCNVLGPEGLDDKTAIEQYNKREV